MDRRGSRHGPTAVTERRALTGRVGPARSATSRTRRRPFRNRITFTGPTILSGEGRGHPSTDDRREPLPLEWRRAIESHWHTVTSASFARAGPSRAIVAAVCGAEILGLAGYSIVPALLPQFIYAWSLTNTQAGWLAGIVSAGYMLAVIPIVSLTDRRYARKIYLASSTLGALSCFGMALCNDLLPALGFRAIAGIAMAGMYMPGLQALTHGVEGTMRSRVAAWYTSSFTVGASLSFLFGRVGTLLGWRSAFVVAGMLGAAGLLIAWAALPREDSGGNPDPQPLLDFRPVLANRDALLLIIGYAAVIWGCVGLRQWIVVFNTNCAG